MQCPTMYTVEAERARGIQNYLIALIKKRKIWTKISEMCSIGKCVAATASIATISHHVWTTSTFNINARCGINWWVDNLIQHQNPLHIYNLYRCGIGLYYPYEFDLSHLFWFSQLVSFRRFCRLCTFFLPWSLPQAYKYYLKRTTPFFFPGFATSLECEWVKISIIP